MEMSEVLNKLKSLQDVLAEKYDIEAKIEDLPKELEISTETLERYKKDYIEKNAEYEAEKTKVAALKLDLDEAVRTREMGEKNMDDIKTHREYEVLDKQISEAQAKEDGIRKDLQKEEKVLDELKDTLAGDEEIIKAQEEEVQESKAKHDANMESFQKQLEELKEKETEMSDGIDSEVVYKFQRIIQRNRQGIVAVTGNVCDGCHMILPYQFANEVRRGDKILFCPYCSRIIYYKPAEDSEENFYSMSPMSMDDTGSLADFDDEEEEGEDENLIEDSDYNDSDDTMSEESEDQDN